MDLKGIKNWLFQNKDELDNKLDSMAMDKLMELAKEYKLEFDSAASKPVIVAAVKAAIEKEKARGADKEQPDTTAPGKVFKYRCKTRCTYKGKLVREGDIIFLDKEQDLTHFELVKESQ